MSRRTTAARTATFASVLMAGTLGLASLTVAAAPPDSTAPAPAESTTTAPPADASTTTVAPAPATTAPASSAPASSAPATTATTAPAAPAATDATATTVAAPTVPLFPGLPPAPVLPSNVETVGPAAGPIKAVGTKNGPGTAVVQQRLLDLGFWDTPVDGRYGFATTQAVMAFQKYTGLNPSGSVDAATAKALTEATEKAHGQTNAGTLVEVDKARQVLFIVVDGKTLWAFNTSTGSGIPYKATNKNDPTKIETGDAQTPNGLYKTNRERPEGWWDGDLGSIYRPKYFNGGIAVHGMTSVPNHPASHGCVRVSTMAMDFIWDSGLIPLHTTVWVHD